MKRICLVLLVMVLGLTAVSCSKYTGTYTAECQNVQHNKFTVILNLKSGGKFTLRTKNEDPNHLLGNISYSGTYEIEKSNDGSKYDVLILHYNEYNPIEGAEPIAKSKRAQITRKGTKVRLTSFFGEDVIILTKK